MSSYLAFPSLPRKRGGLFLLHFPGSRLRLTLSAILPYEARTFLTVIPFGNIPRGRLVKSPIIIARVRLFVKPRLKRKTMTFFEYYFQIILFTAALPLGFGIAVYFCNRTFCSLVGTGRGRPILFGLHVILTPIRELAHLVACMVSFHRVQDFCLLNLHDPEGEIGFVEHDYDRKNPVAVLGNYLFAVMPAALGLFLSMLVIQVCFAGAFSDLAAATEALVEQGAGFGAYASLALGFFPAMLRGGDGSLFAKIVGCLLLLLLSLGVYVSLDDLYSAFSGMLLYGGVALAFAAITALFDARARRLILTAFRTFATAVTALYIVVLIFAVAALAFGALVYLVRMFFGEGRSQLPVPIEAGAEDDDGGDGYDYRY